MRLVTYNVHSCVGTDGRLDVPRVADVIAALRADIVCLQELDVGRARTGGVDQAEAIADLVKMRSRFHPAMFVREEQYGDAILTALPNRVVKAEALPTVNLPGLEPRGALWLDIELPSPVGGPPLQIINTHLGLVPREQRAQAAALLGPEWYERARGRGPLMIVGDMNAPPTSSVYRALRRRLADVQLGANGARTLPTFPSTFPMLRIDHVFASAGINVRRVWVAADPLTKRASDHLPLVVDFDPSGAEPAAAASRS